MADQKNQTGSQPARGQAQMSQSGSQGRNQSSNQPGLARRGSANLWSGSPLASVFQRWNEEMDRLFQDFGVGGSMFSSGQSIWSPQVEMFQRGSELVVRADLPGLSKDDVKVEIADDGLTIQGERRQEHEEDREGWYRNERSYGSFFRAIPLPEGTIGDSAKATFKNGVLEIALQAPPQEVNRGRRLEIKEA